MVDNQKLSTIEWQLVSDRGHGKLTDTLGVGYLPLRKSVCVYSIEYFKEGGGVMKVHAYCRNEEEAKELVKVLTKFINRNGRNG